MSTNGQIEMGRMNLFKEISTEIEKIKENKNEEYFEKKCQNFNLLSKEEKKLVKNILEINN